MGDGIRGKKGAGTEVGNRDRRNSGELEAEQKTDFSPVGTSKLGGK